MIEVMSGNSDVTCKRVIRASRNRWWNGGCRPLVLAFMGLLYAATAAAADDAALERCLLDGLKQAADDIPVSALREQCRQEMEDLSVVEKRLLDERRGADSSFLLAPHKPNYVLPLTYNPRPNAAPYASLDGELQNVELKFQLSLKYEVAPGFFGRDNMLFFAYTNQSYWQAYNRQISSPFREINHEPEVFYLMLQKWSLLGFRSRFISLGLNHQSNGRSGSQSRSWNRVIASFVFERDNLVLRLRPWYRLFQGDEDAPTDPLGDNNPDILDYMGHGEVGALYKFGPHTYSMMLRNMLGGSYRGAVELGWSFPINGRLKGYVQYFNGYGESLIDYDARVNRLGVGFALNDWL